MASKRIRLRTGHRVYLDKVESDFGDVAYFVGGKHPAHRQDFDNLHDAAQWFEGIERGDQPQRFS